MEDDYPPYDAQNRNGAYTLFKKTTLRNRGTNGSLKGTGFI
jgi:hypothetical protein